MSEGLAEAPSDAFNRSCLADLQHFVRQHAGKPLYYLNSRARSLKSGVRPPDALYSQIARSRRKGDQMRQQAIATLGRDDELQASG